MAKTSTGKPGSVFHQQNLGKVPGTTRAAGEWGNPTEEKPRRGTQNCVYKLCPSLWLTPEPCMREAVGKQSEVLPESLLPWQRLGGAKTPLKKTVIFLAVRTKRGPVNKIIWKNRAKEGEPQILSITLCPNLYLTPQQCVCRQDWKLSEMRS